MGSGVGGFKIFPFLEKPDFFKSIFPPDLEKPNFFKLDFAINPIVVMNVRVMSERSEKPVRLRA